MSKLVFIGDLEPLMEQIGGARRKQYERLLAEAARYETMELPAVHPKKSSTYMGIAIVNLALAYRLSKDEKYLTHAKRFMNTVLSYEKWGNAHLVNVDLSASWILFGLSLGYDWLKPYLSEDERKRIAAKLKHHARIIYEYRKETYGKDWSTNYYQNHNWINMNGLATAGYVLQGEDEYAEHYIEMAKENFSRVYSYLADDGSNYEGVVYWRYGGMWLFVYVAIEKARGNGGRILGVNLLMAAAKFTLSGVFVLIFRQGVVMIAFSTLLSNLLVTLIGIYSLRDPKDVFGISLEYIRMDRLFIKKLFGISLPVMAEKFAFSTGKVVVNSVGVDYGTQTVGALGVSNSISALSTVPAGSIGDGGASIIRQNIGSGKKDRALKVFKSVFLVDVAWGTLGFLLTWIFLNPILSVFSGGDAVFAQLIRQIFLLEMLSNIFLAVHAAIMALLYAFGYTKLSFGINFARLFIFRLPILFALKQFTALSGGTAMGIVMMVSNGLTGLLALLVAMVVLRKEYGSGWIKLLLH